MSSPFTPSSIPGSGSGGGGGSAGWQDLLAPYSPNLITGSTNVGGVNGGLGVRVQVGKTGTLKDLSVYVDVSSGNISLAIYNTASPRARQSTSGAVACPAGGAWRIIYDPAFAVTAGQYYDLFLSADNATATFGKVTLPTSGYDQLPANFLPGAGGAPWQTYFIAAGHPAPASNAEGSFVAITGVVCIIGRII